MFNVSLIVGECAGCAVVALHGELDIADATDVAAALAAAEAGRTGIVVDLAGLTFIDCSGVRALAQARARHGGGAMLLAAPRRVVLRVIALTGLIDIGDVYATVEDAVDIADRVHRGRGGLAAHTKRGWPAEELRDGGRVGDPGLHVVG
jgi:anti-sigma B factor antagonist